MMQHLKFLKNASLALLTGLVFSAPALAGPALSPGSNFPFDPPPDGVPGECFARVLIPAQFKTVTEQVVVDEGGSRLHVTAPQFAGQTQQYIAHEGGVRYEVRQPTYRTVTEQVLVRPAHEILQVIPGEYRNVTEQIQISPPRLTWKPGASLKTQAGVRLTQTRQGEVYCLVEEPGETQSISKRVQVRAEQVRAIVVPPVYKTITRQVMVDPGGVREVSIPEQYGSYTSQQLVQPAGHTSTSIAPKMGSVSRRVQTSGESFSWIKVLCKTNATPAAISEVQGLLHRQGYYQGPVDGQISKNTEMAIAKYQQQANIPHGGFLSLETIDSLRGGHPSAPTYPTHFAQAPIRTQAPNYGSTMTRYQNSWTQAVPVQTASYQSAQHATIGNRGAGWQSSYGQSGSSTQAQVYTDGQIISRAPRGEVPTDFVRAQPMARSSVVNAGAQQWHNSQLLNWAGK